MNILYIIVPCYNEEEVINETATKLNQIITELKKQNKIDSKSKIFFVDDGSTDNTWNIISELNNKNPLFSGLKLSRNFGHQNALLAGLLTAKNYCDITISMDADLQDDISAIPKMIDEYEKGSEIVYAVRNNRDVDSFFKKFTANAFYKLIKFLGGNAISNHADFRLMTKRAINELENFKEVNLFLRGLIPMIGLKSSIVYYKRQKRFAGKSKYPLKKMLSFGFDGISSLSVQPIKMIKSLGLIVFFISIVMLVWSVVGYFNGTTVTGWSSLMVSIWAIGGLLILSLGVVGEYVGKIYLESKERPRFIIEKNLDDFNKTP